VWLSSALFGSSPDRTLRTFVSAAERAERLHQQHPDHAVLVMGAFSLVKTYRHEKGATYPDMNWEPEQSFSAVADSYSQHQD
jgi:hypothetical protein